MLSENDLAKIAARIAHGLRVIAIGTFGSYATGTANNKSDVDLFVIREDGDRAPLTERAIRRLLPHVLTKLDIHVFTATEFERRLLQPYSFEWIIAQQARLYYWRDNAPQVLPSLFGREWSVELLL